MVNPLEPHYLSLLAARLDLVHAGLLGILTATMFQFIRFDIDLVRSLFTKTFNLYVTLNRLTYLLVKYIGRAYFVIAILLTQCPTKINCSVTTRTHQFFFYIALVANHWLFCLRALATWRGHHRYPMVLTFALTGLICLTAAAGIGIWDGKIGTVVEPYGCIYLLYEPTLPRLGFSIMLVAIGIFFHTANMILAAMRLSSFSETFGEADEVCPPWASFAANLSTNFTAMLRGDMSSGNRKHSGAVLAEVLIKQGFLQWMAHLLGLIFFIFVPIFAFRDNPIVVMAGISFYTAADIEFGSYIFRATSEAMRAPLLEQTTSTFFSSRPLEGIPMGRSVHTPEPRSPQTSRDAMLTAEKPVTSPSRAHLRSREAQLRSRDEENRANAPFSCNCFANDGFDSHV